MMKDEIPFKSWEIAEGDEISSDAILAKSRSRLASKRIRRRTAITIASALIISIGIFSIYRMSHSSLDTEMAELRQLLQQDLAQKQEQIFMADIDKTIGKERIHYETSL